MNFRLIPHHILCAVLLAAFVFGCLPLEALGNGDEIAWVQTDNGGQESDEDDRSQPDPSEAEFFKVLPQSPRANLLGGKLCKAWVYWHSRSKSLHVLETPVPPPELLS